MNDWTAKQIVFGRTFADTILAALTARPATALIVTPKVRLTTDPSFNPQPSNVIADFTASEANYSGYTAGGIAPTLSGALNLTPTIQGVNATVLFIATTASPFVTSNVTGWWLDDGTNVIAAEAFGPGNVAAFASAGDFLNLEIRLPVGLFQPTL